MATLSRTSSPLGTDGRDAAGIQRWFEANAALGASIVNKPVRPTPSNIGVGIVALSDQTGLSPAVMAGLVALESAWWQSDISQIKNNPSGHGAENDDPFGKATTFKTPAEGLRVTYAHMMVYIGVNVGYWQQFDDRAHLVIAKGWSGSVKELWHLEQKWAWSDPTIYFNTALEQRYGAKIAARGNSLLRSLILEPAVNPTDRMISLLRQQGFDVHDVRGQLPVNPNPSLRYTTMPLSNVQYWIQHWTGDSFGDTTLDTILGSNQPGRDIRPDLSVDEEKKLLKWYANYHISRDGNSWGGLAYGTLVFPSGRVYVAWNIGTKTYHAFNANGVSYALCCPNANSAAPFPRQLLALHAIWDILCYETPECPAGKAQLIGHTEAKSIDTRNQTSCPGTFLPHVQSYRASPPPGETPDPPIEPVGDPNALKIQNGNREIWVVNLVDEDIMMLDLFRSKGDVEICGLPMDGMRLRDDGVYVQPFENVELEIWPGGWGYHPGPHGRFGGAVRRLMEENARLRAVVAHAGDDQ
jgi:hypothetical protein